MKAGTYINPDHTASFMADKTMVRFLLALKAAHGLVSEHFDISSAYLHEKFMHSKNVHIRQHPLFNGDYKGPFRGN